MVYDKRIIGIDYGTKRIGISYSDPLRITAQPLTTVVLKSRDEAVKRVCEALSSHDVELIVLGLPVSLSGGKGGKMAEEIKQFATQLEKKGYRIVFEDEQFTSAEAMSTMRRAGKTEKQMRGKADSIAAQLILQTYLDEHSGSW